MVEQFFLPMLKRSTGCTSATGSVAGVLMAARVTRLKHVQVRVSLKGEMHP